MYKTTWDHIRPYISSTIQNHARQHRTLNDHITPYRTGKGKLDYSKQDNAGPYSSAQDHTRQYRTVEDHA